MNNYDLIKSLSLESKLCLSVLISNNVIEYTDRLDDALEDFPRYFDVIEGDCTNCKFNDNCLACIINE